MRVIRDSLADGRELIYFDDATTTLPAERKPDSRTLDPRPETAELRQDPLTGEWITIAKARQNRVMLPPAHLDPLAPQTPDNPSEIPDQYDVAVFENRSPSFGPAQATPNTEAPLGIGLERATTSVGRCEVVCFSPEHEGSYSTLGETRARTVIEAWAHRTYELSQIPGVQQVFPFENRGEAIGVTLHHPHGQIYSYPYVTPRTQRLQASVRDYGTSLMGDILDRERNGSRVILAGEHWTAFVPFAARWPIEVHLLPHRDIPDFAHTSLDERDELAYLHPRLLRMLDSLYDTPTPYISAWHQAPLSDADGIRMMLQVTSPRRGADKMKFLAGSEAAMGAWVGDLVPENAAAAMRDALALADEKWTHR
ncbi:galactose-1-phosphate uridylyltransferase [Demequina sp. B12]|uniref:galactose-1-phosphate uridylyltransferase n=1 Tax=Demequina sp. B12 TaxID=2992757 RepID=UPI00237AF0A2|nr:galactose-1-phosphate uridylyltransferase [Demequina sp. B12]MDE0571922.1 galactose-1-phosphate uridylyltransferase [Demequina sp. B12]